MPTLSALVKRLVLVNRVTKSFSTPTKGEEAITTPAANPNDTTATPLPIQLTRQIPQELFERIIDQLSNDPRSLAACRLVCRSWVPASGYHLFQHCVVLPLKLGWPAQSNVNEGVPLLQTLGISAGLTVASRLAENPKISVLVIEAGPNAQNDTLVNDPGQFLVVLSVYNWGYNTTIQASGGGVHALMQGKVLGGSSSINGMCWTRGTIEQYDSIEQLGNPGWNSQSLFHYMKKAEFYHLPNLQQVALGATVDPLVHGFRGKVNAGFPQPYEGTVVAQSMIAAAVAAIPGLVKNDDVASGTPNGAARFQYSIKPGNKTDISPTGNVRSSSANAYIYPSLQAHPNLLILTGHQATRLVWGPRSMNLSQAVGVKFIPTPAPNTSTPMEYEVKVALEVVVASGSIGVDLPAVGTNLQDQALNLIEFAVAQGINASDHTFINAPLTPAVAFVDVEQLLGTDAAQALANDLSQSITPSAKEIVSSGAFTSVSGLEKVLNIQTHSIFKLKAPVIEYSLAATSELIGASFWNLIPRWRGTVHIKSTNPSVRPEVDPRYFTGGQFDLFLNGNATRLGRQLFNTPPLKKFIGEELSPGLATVPKNASESQFQEWVQATYNPVFHPIGSVPMLPKTDGGAVGPDLVVYGTSNVRVVGE
ncbi:hypothetical protein H0H93_007689 [Arthromyces matolae]|nr:hypothetical protein H0H93_007689 [Arthromyces matolae]